MLTTKKTISLLGILLMSSLAYSMEEVFVQKTQKGNIISYFDDNYTIKSGEGDLVGYRTFAEASYNADTNKYDGFVGNLSTQPKAKTLYEELEAKWQEQRASQ